MTRRAKQSPKLKDLSTPYSEVVQLIRQGKSFLVTTHSNPDGDALGSALALGTGLLSLRKKVKIYNQDPVPKNLAFLPGSEKVTQQLAASEQFDAAFIVDCAEKDRVSEIFAQHRGYRKLVILDHHIKSDRSGDLNIIEPKAASSGVVVLKLLQRLKVSLNRALATQIYCTLVTDTGNFRYSNTDADVLRLAARLVDQGVAPWLIAKNIYESYPIERLKLMGQVLSTLDVSKDARYASLVLTETMLRETGATADLSDEFINLARSVDSVEVAMMFREIDSNHYKVSFRSKEFIDVAKLAARFGGGGHQRAAGCKLEGTLEQVRRSIIAAVEGAFQGSKRLYK